LGQKGSPRVLAGDVDSSSLTALNRICPYFTMFPLRVPYGIMRRHGRSGQRVLDPFCGRGTTIYAARLLGLEGIGLDSSPVAAAVAAAKTVTATTRSIVRAYRSALESIPQPTQVPDGGFWRLAYHPRTLQTLCRLREALLVDCRSDSRVALRAILLGALHGPLTKGTSSYLSNQSPRTFAPKPAYAERFWVRRNLEPRDVNVEAVVRTRAERYFAVETTPRGGEVRLADSRRSESYRGLPDQAFDWVITSPPYYGMRTYVPDQWLRNWFVGGPDVTDYSAEHQLRHSSPTDFAAELKQVWQYAGRLSKPGARMMVRFGGINDRTADPVTIIKASLKESAWEVSAIRSAGLASAGKRQAAHFGAGVDEPRAEFDVWAVRTDGQTACSGISPAPALRFS